MANIVNVMGAYFMMFIDNNHKTIDLSFDHILVASKLGSRCYVLGQIMREKEVFL